ncbi:MAG: isochorismatase family protein [Brevinema sp.]
MRILLEDTSLLVVDIQEKFVPHIYEYQLMLNNCLILIKSCKLLTIPIAVSEQNSSKLGHTVPEIRSILPEQKHLEKIEFSCYDAPSYQQWLKKHLQKNIILCGIESHICILQTAIDLKNSGYTPIVIWDTISSRKLENKEIALRRLIQENILISSCESILFELMRTFEHPHSREISNLIK